MSKQKNKIDEDSKFFIPIRSGILGLIIQVLVSKNSNILYKDYANIYKLFSCIDETLYISYLSDIELKYYILFINDYLSERINNKVYNRDFILSKLLEEHKYKDIYQKIYDRYSAEISNSELNMLRAFISERLRFIFLYKNMNEIEDLILQVKTNDFDSLSELSEEYESIIKNHFIELVGNKAIDDEYINNIIMDEDGIQVISKAAHEKENLGGVTLETGFAEIEKIRRSEATIFLAPTGNFKSGMLMNLAHNIKKYNPTIETRDKTKKPLILYLSFENPQELSFKRFAKLVLNCSHTRIKETDPSILAKEMFEELNKGEHCCKEALIEFAYRKSNTCSATDVLSMIEEREEMGYEVIALLADYLKLFKPRREDRGAELRHRLSNTMRDLADIAVVKQIALVTAFQLNIKQVNKNAPLDISMIEEASAILHHVDQAYLQRRKFDVYNKLHYIEISNGKTRTVSDSSIFVSDEEHYIPFDIENGFKILPTKFNKPEATSLVNKIKDSLKKRPNQGGVNKNGGFKPTSTNSNIPNAGFATPTTPVGTNVGNYFTKKNS